jgi:hypothetical protein
MNTKQDDCAVVAFYGIDKSPARLLRAYNAVVAWFDQINVQIDRAGVNGKGFSGKQALFTRLKRRIDKDAFRTIDVISLTALREGALTPVFDWNATVDISARSNLVTVAANAKLMGLPDLVLGPTTKGILEALSPEYGIGYSRPLNSGPAFYAIGLLQGPTIENDDERLRIARWGTGTSGMRMEVYRDGLLRDVYPWNFLSKPQLQRRIDGVPLEKWISAGKNRGELRTCSTGLKLWNVDMKHQPAIFKTLWDAGAIFNWRNYVED